MDALPLLPWMKKDPLPGSAVSIENTHCPVPPNPPPTGATGAKPLPPDGGGGGGVSWACAVRGAVTNAKVSKAAEVNPPKVPRGGRRYEGTKRFVGAVVMPDAVPCAPEAIKSGFVGRLVADRGGLPQLGGGLGRLFDRPRDDRPDAPVLHDQQAGDGAAGGRGDLILERRRVHARLQDHPRRALEHLRR